MPGEVKIGFSGLTLISRDADWDPRLGISMVEVWEGDRDAIEIRAAQLRISPGIRVATFPHEGPIYRLRAYWPDARDGVTRVSVEYEVDTELAQLDIRNNPKVIAAAGTSETLAIWWKDIKEKNRNGQPLGAGEAVEKQKLYTLVARGAEVYEIERIVLRVMRNSRAGSAAPRTKLTAVPVVYTTDTLIGLLNLPAYIVAQLPPTPGPADTPSDTVWAWKRRVNRTRTTIAGRTVKGGEVLDFVFAAWSTLLVDVI